MSIDGSWDSFLYMMMDYIIFFFVELGSDAHDEFHAFIDQ
jgi:hypothetical protein